ncbi:MBL fold metallo-hydrolase [Leifsonia sp. YIM 134122]|uniref:MBL fold metallo-hydrolase n=1 Tax=Leifsonia stereocauli TaxID=3134136 RepID=A0ABU9W2T7_9MICO
MQLAPSLHRIGNDIVAAYLVDTEDGVTIIDAGLPGHWRDLEKELAAMGRGISEVRGLVLTHGDSDHIGFAERLRREQGVPIYVHEADAARARGEFKPKAQWGRMRLGGVASFFWYAARKGGLRTTYLREVTTMTDGDVLDLPGAPRIIGLPGHSAGSVAIHVPTVGALFVGDALTTRHVLTGSRGPQPAPFTDEPAQAIDSLTHLEGLGATWVLPGHGAPSRGGSDEVIRQVRAAASAGTDHTS